MRVLPRSLAALACLGGLACADPPSTAPASPAAPSAGKAPAGADFVVMTQNTDPGINFDPIMAAQTVPDLLNAVADGWAQLLASDLPGRAGAVARLIAKNQPDLVALQEVALYRVRNPSDGLPATTVAFDYLQMLRDSLQVLGADYQVAVMQTETDAQVPMLTETGLEDLRWTDHDVILVRTGVTFTNPQHGLYAARIPLSLGGQSLEIVRGWVSVDAAVGGGTVRFVGTHFQSQDFQQIQVPQAQELAGIVGSSPYPVVLVGDLNSAANADAPDSRKTPTYPYLTGTVGFVDAWTLASSSAGLTCCHPDVLNEKKWRDAFDQRLDLVLLRSGPSADWRYVGVHAAVVGQQPFERTASGLWPSDHAGVVATLRLAR